MRKNLWILIAPITHFLASYLMLFTYWPEMLNYPFFLLRGLLPYRDFSMVYTPLLPLILAGIYRVLGPTPYVLHLFASLLLATIDLLITSLVFRSTKSKVIALTSGLFAGYIILSFEGNHLWFDSFLTLVIILIFWLQLSFLRQTKLWKLLVIGALYGICILTKQQSSLYLSPALFFFFFLLKQKFHYSWRNLFQAVLIFLLPMVGLLILFLSILNQLNILTDFLNWGFRFVFTLTSVHGANLSPDLVYPTSDQLLRLSPFLLLLAIVSRSPGFLTPTSSLALLWLFSTVLFAFPRFGYFHLEAAIPFFVILVFSSWPKIKPTFWPTFSVCLVLISTTTVLRYHLRFGQSFYDPDVKVIAKWIKHYYPQSSIYSLNGPDLVYVLTDKTPSALPWVDQLSWNMAFFGDRYIEAFSKKPPDLVIFVPYKTGQYQPEAVIAYVSSHYLPVESFPFGVEILKKYR